MNRMSIEQFRARLTAETGAVPKLYRTLARRPDPLRALTARGDWYPWMRDAEQPAGAR